MDGDLEAQLREYQAKVQELGWEDAWDWAEAQGYSRQQIRELERETIHRRNMEELGMWIDHLEEAHAQRSRGGMSKRINWRGRDHLFTKEHECIGPDCPGRRGAGGPVQIPFELMTDTDLSIGATRVYAVLSFFGKPGEREDPRSLLNHDTIPGTRTACIPQSVIAAILDYDERTVGRHIAHLKERGYIEEVYLYSPFSRPHTYRLVFD